MSVWGTEQNVFATGNEVVARAAIAARAEIMYGYPITPQNEIMHYWTRLAPQYDRRFLQTEDELSAGFATIGAVLAGKRAFTATAGPGTVLMQEPLSMAEMMRLPLVTVVQQRGGPSTATVIYSQQEVTLCCYGGNGEGFRVVYSTAGNQELYDYTLRAFHTAWRYRYPTIVLGDGYQAKMRESVVLYDPAARGVATAATEPLLGAPGLPGRDREPVHLQNTYNTEEELLRVIETMAADYTRDAAELIEYDSDHIGDAEIVLVAHGIVSRACAQAVTELRARGLRAGLFRPITLRPFPTQALRAAVTGRRELWVIESAQGQLKRLVCDELYGLTVPLREYFKPGMSITAEEIVRAVLAEGGGHE